MYDIIILEMQSSLVLSNFQTVILKDITFDKFSYVFSGEVISFIDCKEILIENLNIIDSHFNSGTVFSFSNVGNVRIVNLNIIDSSADILLLFN